MVVARTGGRMNGVMSAKGYTLHLHKELVLRIKCTARWLQFIIQYCTLEKYQGWSSAFSIKDLETRNQRLHIALTTWRDGCAHSSRSWQSLHNAHVHQIIPLYSFSIDSYICHAVLNTAFRSREINHQRELWRRGGNANLPLPFSNPNFHLCLVTKQKHSQRKRH